MESVSTRLRKRKREIVKNCLREYRDQGLAAPLQAEPALNLGIKGLADFIENGQSEGTDVFIEHVAEKVVKKELRPSEGFHIISALRQSTTPVILQETDQSNLLTAMRKVDTYFSRLTEKILSGLEGNSLRGGSEAEKVQRGLEEVERKIIKYTFKKSRGWVDVGGTRMCLLDIPGGWLNIGESIKLFAGGDTSRRVMYEAGLSETFIKRAIEKGVLDYSAQSVGEAIDTFSEAGFGNFVIKELNFSEGYARITCRDSFEGWAHLYNNKCTDKPVCFYSAGVLLSFMQKITRRTDLYSVETHCIAKGDDACEFVIGAQKQLLAKGVRLPEWGQTIKERAEYLENLLEEKNRVEREITLRNKELSALNKISATVNQSLNLEEILNLAVFELSKIVGDKEIGIYLLDRKKEELIFSAHKGYSEEFHKYVSRLKIGEGVVGSVVQQQKPIAYDDYATCPHALIPVMERAKIKSVMCVPLMAKDKIVGVMNIASKISCHFSSEEINLMTLIGNQMGVAIENAQLHEEITESQREYKTLVEDINDGYFICQEGKIIFTNKAFLTMHGYRQEEVLGRRLEDLFFSESIQQVERVYRDRLEDKRISEHIEFRRKHRDGSELPTELKINCVEFKGNPALVGIMRDISERRKMEQKILDSQRLASIGELAAAIAHEIRNPLSAIKMNIQILSKGIKLEGFDKRRLEIAADEINRLDRIVEDVVDFARPIQMKRKERDINDIIGRCIDLLSDKIREKDVQVVRSTCDNLKGVSLDCEKMEQAILNIVLNSIDAMPKGGRLEIAIGESEYEGRRMMRVDVTDTGIGMSPEQKKKIFDPFFTTKSTGVGLGLSNVKKIIEGHEGVIKVKSKVNEGTTFSFMLPTEQ